MSTKASSTTRSEPAIGLDKTREGSATTPTQATEHILRDLGRRAAFSLRLGVLSLTVAVVSVFGNVLLGGFALWLWVTEPPPQVLALTTDNRLVKLQPLKEPVYSDIDIGAYVDRALHYAHNYSFADYPWRNEEACQQFFTTEGCSAFRKAIARNIEVIRERHLTSKLSIEKPPLIVGFGSIAGRYAWDVQVVIRLTFESSTERRAQTETVTLRVVRVSVLEDTGGLGIHKYLAT